jgi:hypothetical protein
VKVRINAAGTNTLKGAAEKQPLPNLFVMQSAAGSCGAQVATTQESVFQE